MNISILLSTYNGETFLKAQIESIISQTNTDWCLYIRDDGSEDGTVKIIDIYCDKHPDQIKKIEDAAGNLKSARSFMHMLGNVNSTYYMFCDQDDVWLPFKIEVTLKKIKEIEANHPNKGVLAFTDLEVVGPDLKMIDESMWNYNKINPENAKDFYKTTCLSSITGCTLMFNNAIKEAVLPYPQVALMHDWWISLNAAHSGIVGYLSNSTVLYRQHEHNVLGAEKLSKNHYLKRLFVLKKTMNENIKVLRMLHALPFEVNYLKFFASKITVLLKGFFHKKR